MNLEPCLGAYAMGQGCLSAISAHELQTGRQDILTELGGFTLRRAIPVNDLTPKQLTAFAGSRGSSRRTI